MWEGLVCAALHEYFNGRTPRLMDLWKFRYPHFVGTIHGFVNEFLAMPWLRSAGVPIRMIDDEVCLKRRWAKLGFRTRAALEKAGHSQAILRIKTSDLDLGEIR